MGERLHAIIEDGDVTTPLGGSFQVTGGSASRSVASSHDITGPGDGADKVYMDVGRVFRASVNGYAADGSAKIGEGDEGAAKFKLGNGELWEGPVKIERVEASPQYEKEGEIPVAMTVRFKGKPEIT